MNINNSIKVEIKQIDIIQRFINFSRIHKIDIYCWYFGGNVMQLI